jgi:hypothetical protein
MIRILSVPLIIDKTLSDVSCTYGGFNTFYHWLIDKVLLLTVASLATQFSQVKVHFSFCIFHFSSKLRANDTICGSATVFLTPSAHHLGVSLARKAIELRCPPLILRIEALFGQTHPAHLFFKMSSLVDNGVKSSIFNDVYALLLSGSCKYTDA